MVISRLNIQERGNKRSAVFKAYKDKGIDPKAVKIYEVGDNIPFNDIRVIGKEGRKRDDRKLLELPICLDTETSYYKINQKDYVAWIYQWCLRVGYIYIGGRTPEELIKALRMIKAFYHLDAEKKAVIYIHNASYDWQFIKYTLSDEFGAPEILATAPRHIIYAEYDSFIIRDSYVLANRSLAKWCDDLSTRVKKVVAGIDYRAIVYQDDELSDNDWYYQLNDVESLYCCIIATLKQSSDTLFSIPLTSTGYVRRDSRREFRKEKKNYFEFRKLALNERTYHMCNQAYRGAYTHGNRFYQEFIVDAVAEGYDGIGHRDYRSFYPSTVECDKYPATPFRRDLSLDIDWILKYKDDYACLCEIEISNIKIKDGISAPILSTDQCRKNMISFGKIINDNGRVLWADGTYKIVVTEIDLYWIMKQYNLDIELTDLYISRKRKLPDFIRNVNKEYFKAKTVFKQLAKRKDISESERFDYDQSLMISKNKLNAIYGMLATNIVHSTFEFNFETFKWLSKNLNVTDELEKYYNNFNSFASYQFGCWITANCRNRLLSTIEAIGYDKFLYCDTDSIFYLKDKDTEAFFTKMNEDNYKLRLERGEYIEDTHGDIVEFMTFEDEEDNIMKFKFLHSKCYGFYDSKGKMTTTIAGVTKFYREDLALPVEERRTREYELNYDLNNLDDGFKFTHCGGSQAAYYEHLPDITFIEGHRVEYESGCVILDNTKTLNRSDLDLFEIERIYEIR